ncbi:MAG: ABC transporter substrate-binding protein [Nitrospiraceae bacterium]|nr:MAG: ABC transporter substrate-binding protein [Nitrospiraceae bacterium]
MTLRIGHLSTFYHTSMLLIAKGEMRTDVRWNLFPTGPALVDAFQKGEIDMAYIGLPPAIIGIDKGVRITCIAGGHIEGTVIIGRVTDRGFPDEESLRDIIIQFRGLRVGVPGKGSIHDVILSEYLERFHLKNDVEVINFRWADQIVDAMYKGPVSAAVGTPALAVSLARYARGKILYPPSKLWPNNPSYGILVERSFLKEHRSDVEQFLMLHEEATSMLRNRPAESAKIIADFTGIVDEDFVLDTLKISPKYCSKITDEYISSTMKFVAVLKKLGYIRRAVSSNEIFDTSLINKLHPAKDHYQDGLAI